MSVFTELEKLGKGIGADVQRFVSEGTQAIEPLVVDDGQPLFTLLRDVMPVLDIHGIAIVTRYHDVLEVLTNDDAFGVEPYSGKMQALAGPFILGLNQSPEYEHDSSILRLAARQSDIPGLSAFVEQTADQLVDEAITRDGFVELPELATRVPARLFGEWFGIALPQEPDLIAWTLAMFNDIFYNVLNNAEVHGEAMAAGAKLRPYLNDRLAANKAENGGGAIGRLVAMQAAEPSAFTDEQIVTNLIGIVVGFIPTVVTAMASAIDALLDRPEQLAAAHRAARANDEDTVRSYLWEAMRLAPLAPGLLRRARRDFVVAEGTDHATLVRAGTLTFAATESAMLDGAVVKHPHEFRTDRPPQDYLHFGAGLHQCFGRVANTMQLPLIAKSLLRHENLSRMPGEAGKLKRDGPYPKSLAVTFDH